MHRNYVYKFYECSGTIKPWSVLWLYQREEQLKILGQMRDSDIDYSDAAPTDPEFWKDAALHIPSEKVQVSIRLDQDVIAWYKKQTTRGYQTFINAVLRDYMQKQEGEIGK